MKKKLISTLVALTMSLTIFTGCGGKKNDANNSANTTGKVKDKIVYATTTAPAGTFNPLLAYMGSDGDIDSMVYSSLLRMKQDGSLESYLAESYDVSEDQKTITFKLKNNVKWHDGKKVTAEDVAYTFLTMAHKDFPGTDYSKVEKLVGAKDYHEGKADNIKGLQVIDEYTIKFEFAEIYAPALSKIGTYEIIPKHIWEPIPYAEWEKKTEMLNKPIGCGPYKVTKYESGQYVELAAFDEFFGGKPKTPKLIFKVVNADAITAEFKSGNIDIAGVKELKKSEIEPLEKQGYKLLSYDDDMYQYIGINMRMPIFQDKNLRQAFMYAVDRQLIIDKLLEGRGSVLNAPFMKNGWANPADGSLNEYKYDPEKAKSLLEASGWVDKDGDGIRENAEGKKLQFTMRCSNDSKTREQAIMIVQDSWKKVGIDIKVSVEEDAKMAEDCIYNHEFELYALNCYFGSDPDPYFWWHSNSAHDEKGVGSFNFGAYKNKDVDQNIEKALGTLKQDERAKYYEKVAKQINEDAPMMFLYTQNKEMLYNGKLNGFEPTTFNTFYNINNWVIQE